MSIPVPRVKPAFEGYLTKRSAWLKEWRRRYFRLIGNKLYFSKDAKDEAHGVIDLQTCLTVKSADDKTGKSNSFEVATAEEVYYMFADSDSAKDEWIGAIGKAIVSYSNSYAKSGGSAGAAAAVDDDDDDDDDDEDDEE